MSKSEFHLTNKKTEVTMFKHKQSIFFSLLTLFLVMIIAGVTFPAQAQSSQSSAPVYLSFDKTLVGNGIWEGSVTGDVTGNLRTELTSLRVAGPIWHVQFNWIIDADEYSFTARLNGTLNTLTGQVVMNGTVVDGWLLGAQVHEEGQLIDPNTLRFQGTIQVMPATSD
jgi:hypothetical protein